MDWTTVFRAERDGPRKLTDQELGRLARNGFPELAAHFAAGRCDDCGHTRASSFHAELCVIRKRPVEALAPIRQPWQPRPARERRAA